MNYENLDEKYPIEEGYYTMKMTLRQGVVMSEDEAKQAYQSCFGGDNEFFHFSNHGGKVVLVGRKKEPTLSLF